MEQFNRNPTGVTVIELLIVLSIIAILLSLLIPLFAAVRRKGQVRATETLVSAVSAALNQYYTDWDEYPPSTFDYDPNGTTPTVARLSGPAPDAYSLYKYLNGSAGDGFTARNHHYGPYLKNIPKENLLTTAGGTVIVDAWRHPLAYLNCQAHLQIGGSLKLCHNNSFDLYSIGPDGRKDPLNDYLDNNGDGRVDEAAELVDDITNW